MLTQGKEFLGVKKVEYKKKWKWYPRGSLREGSYRISGRKEGLLSGDGVQGMEYLKLRDRRGCQ